MKIFIRWRGKMLYQVCKTKMFLADIKHSKVITMDTKEFLAGAVVFVVPSYCMGLILQR